MVVSSYATADRSRRKLVGEIDEDTKDQREPPKLCTLYWDDIYTSESSSG